MINLSSFLGKFGGLRNTLIIAAVLVATHTSFGVGGYLMGQRNESRAQVETITKTIYVPVKEIQEVQVRNVERERELQEQLSQSRSTAQSLRNQLANRPVPSDCTVVDPVNVGLLNEAIDNGAPPSSAGVSVSEAGTVTPRDLELWAVDAAAQYNEVSARYNALIDWVEEELIEPQRVE